jgi:alkanesulfonate monooxygenase SsuD/methylene tetrahydromethanopterin reductase-like flavin-dependent oxidoreductase (luciferase family)
VTPVTRGVGALAGRWPQGQAGLVHDDNCTARNITGVKSVFVAITGSGRQELAVTYTFGLDTFGDRNSDASGHPLSHAQTIRNVAEEGVFAEQAGVDFFGIGEHHTEAFPMSAADVVLGAIAARTSRIHLGSAVTVLSSDDPVRVFQRYSTLNALSAGRAEVIIGRGSSVDSFPLFGYDLADYEELFDEKATLFAELLKGGPVTWDGKTRAPLLNQDVVPHTESGPFPAWIGVGGNPESVVRAARLGFGLALAIIGGPRCSSGPWRSSAARRSRSWCTPPATSRPPTSRPRRSSGPAGGTSSP